MGDFAVAGGFLNLSALRERLWWGYAVRLYISVQWCSVGQSVSKDRSGSAGFGLVVRVQMEAW